MVLLFISSDRQMTNSIGTSCCVVILIQGAVYIVATFYLLRQPSRWRDRRGVVCESESLFNARWPVGQTCRTYAIQVVMLLVPAAAVARESSVKSVKSR